ncbi:hypothetical protein KIH74_30365 [Kineosporia sp. J2-2]|uniref:chitinase n=1 Tax=Kineosporia corallincola TaxID=2835133 RepID=A0ABS5TQN6_9ACTN|nr:glycosyl hydrolase family 18 protein [Kineosporia corallincola]MBT0773288.1 hypothetical protein [Kineosporia corallincola]
MRRSGLLALCLAVASAVGTTSWPLPAQAGTPVAAAPRARVVGYYTSWSVYGDQAVPVKAMHTSGAASRMTHVLYAFGAVRGGKCEIGDAYADYRRLFPASESVDGVADSASQALAGNFNQLRELKRRHPGLKVLWSFGGGASGGFSRAARKPVTFAKSCRALVEDERWGDVFDGIDIDWEYPNACGKVCDRSGYSSYPALLKAVRGQFRHDLVTSAVTGNGRAGGTLDRADYAGGVRYLDWLMPMTYDYYGTWARKGPTAPHAPLSDFPGAQFPGFDARTVIARLRSQGVPSRKLLLGIPFYGRGWTGVTQAGPGGRARGPAGGTSSGTPGVDDYKVLADRCPPTGYAGDTAYAKCGRQWWSYDTPRTVGRKMRYARQQKLGGAFFWDFSGDTRNASMTRAIAKGLR